MSLGAARFPARLGPLELPTPVLVAAGCAGSGLDLLTWGDVRRIGALTTPTLRALPREAMPRVRMARGAVTWTPDGCGAAAEPYCDAVLPGMQQAGARVVAAIAGAGVAELAAVCRVLRTGPGHDAIVAVELSLGDEDPHEPGRRLLDDPATAARMVARVREELPVGWPVLLRLEDERQDPRPLAAQALRSGAAGFVVSGCLPALLPGESRPVLLSGPVVLGHTASRLARLHRAMRAGEIPAAPLIGVGGIRDADDAAHLIGCGATTVAVGSAMLSDPHLAWRLVEELPPLVRTGLRRTADDAAGHLLTGTPSRGTTLEETP